MKITKIIILFFIFSAPISASDQEPRSCELLGGPVKPIFATARREEGNLLFSPIFEVNWKGIAPDWITGIDTNNPTETALKLLNENRYYESYSQLSYEAPLDCTTSIGKHHLISDAGINPVIPLNLRGRARFIFHGTKISSRGFYGDIVVSFPSEEAPPGGFVMLAGEKNNDGIPLKINVDPEFSVIENDGKVTYTYQTSNRELKMTQKWDEDYDHPLGISKMYKFRMNAKDYIYVRWTGISPKCKFEATLFEAFEYAKEPYLKIVTTASANCAWA